MRLCQLSHGDCQEAATNVCCKGVTRPEGHARIAVLALITSRHVASAPDAFMGNCPCSWIAWHRADETARTSNRHGETATTLLVMPWPACGRVRISRHWPRSYRIGMDMASACLPWRHPHRASTLAVYLAPCSSRSTEHSHANHGRSPRPLSEARRPP